MKNILFTFILLFPFLSICQISKDEGIVILMEATIFSNYDQLSEIINIEPYKTEGDKIYYYMADVDLFVVKNLKDGGATFQMPANEDVLKQILNEFLSKEYELEPSDNVIFAYNSLLFFSITKKDDKMIFMGMEKSKVPN